MLFLDASLYIVKLNPIDSDTGGCLANENNDTYECVCKANYQILVNREFYSILRLIILDTVNSDEKTDDKQFSALIILLKFMPLHAIFYLANMFKMNNVSSNLPHFIPNDIMNINFDGEVVPENVPGKLENREQLSEMGNKLFIELLQFVIYNCDIRSIANNNKFKLDKDTLWTGCKLIFYIVFFLRISFNIFNDIFRT